MRKILLATAGFIMIAFTASAQEKQTTLEGNGKLVTRDVPVQSFDALKASGVYELKLVQGNKEAVKIEADENLQDLFQVKNEGSKLIIDMKKMQHVNLKMKDKIRVFVTFKNLKSLDLSTVGNIISDSPLTFDQLEVSNKSVGNVDLDFTANKLELNNKSVGNVKLHGKAQTANFHNDGVGSLQAGEFLVQTIKIENNGVGSAVVNAEKDLRVKDSFLGKVKNKGAAAVHKMNKVVI